MKRYLLLLLLLALPAFAVEVRVPADPLDPSTVRAASPAPFDNDFEYYQSARPKIGNVSGSLLTPADSGGVVWIQSFIFPTEDVFQNGGTVASADLHISLDTVFYNDPAVPADVGPVVIQGAFIGNAATEPLTDWAVESPRHTLRRLVAMR